ncbi:MAG: hypothetical protein AAF360_01095 [Pseudomonadota bacterium]
MSKSEAVRVFDLDRGAVSKMTQFSAPQGYRLIKQRHTIKRLSERLCEERGFKGG